MALGKESRPTQLSVACVSKGHFGMIGRPPGGATVELTAQSRQYSIRANPCVSDATMRGGLLIADVHQCFQATITAEALYAEVAIDEHSVTAGSPPVRR